MLHSISVTLSNYELSSLSKDTTKVVKVCCILMFKPRAELLCSYYSSSGNYTHYPRTRTQFGVLFGEKTFQCQVNTLLGFLQGGTQIISLYLSIIPGFSEKIQFNPSFPYAVYNFSRTIFLTSKLKQGW